MAGPYTAFTFDDPLVSPGVISRSSPLTGMGGGFTYVGAPIWPSFSFAAPVLGVAYSQTFDLSPAAGPITYAVASGSLPTGLSLSSSGTTGTLSGTPTSAGTYTFTLSATNSAGSNSQSFTVTVSIVSAGGNYGWVS